MEAGEEDGRQLHPGSDQGGPRSNRDPVLCGATVRGCSALWGPSLVQVPVWHRLVCQLASQRLDASSPAGCDEEGHQHSTNERSEAVSHES